MQNDLTCSLSAIVNFALVSSNVVWMLATCSCKVEIIWSFSTNVCCSFMVPDSSSDILLATAKFVICLATSNCSYGSDGNTVRTFLESSDSPWSIAIISAILFNSQHFVFILCYDEHIVFKNLKLNVSLHGFNMICHCSFNNHTNKIIVNRPLVLPTWVVFSLVFCCYWMSLMYSFAHGFNTHEACLLQKTCLKTLLKLER